MDVDFDGVPDIVSGSYQQGLSVFRGLGKGVFSDPLPLTDSNGEEIRPGIALAPAFADWDGDGGYDLILGTAGGEVLILMNSDDGLGSPQTFTVDGTPIHAMHGGPSVSDFDGDGTLDLLVGDLSGALTLYFGTEKGSLDLERGPNLLSAKGDDPKPGIRLKSSVVDWNGDGKLDLLVGDYRAAGSPVLNITEAQAERLKMLTMEGSAIAYEIFKLDEVFIEKALEAAGIDSLEEATPMQRRAYSEALNHLRTTDPGLKKLQKRKRENKASFDSAPRPERSFGTVWIMLRK